MPMFKLKSPDAYPAYILRVVELAYPKLVGQKRDEARVRIGPTWATLEDALREQRRFNAFKMHLRQHPLHRLHEALERIDFRCRILQDRSGFYLELSAKLKGKGLAEVKAAILGEAHSESH